MEEPTENSGASWFEGRRGWTLFFAAFCVVVTTAYLMATGAAADPAACEKCDEVATAGTTAANGLLSTDGFPPRWQCGTWATSLGVLHITADLIIWASYLAIPVILGLLLLRRPDVPRSGVLNLFIAFILLCGIGHLIEATMFYWPGYRLSGMSKSITALVSAATVIMLVRISPMLGSLQGPAELRRLVALRTNDLQAEKVRAEDAHQAKDAFFENISHELRTPLHGVLSYAKLGAARAPEGEREKLEAFFKQIADSGEDLLTMLDELLDVAKRKSDTLEVQLAPVDVSKVVSNVLDEFRSLVDERQLKLTINNCSQVELSIDALRIRQVIRNLLSNAVKFAPLGSQIDIETNVDDDFYTIQVMDRGIGIASEDVEMIFDRFSQSRQSPHAPGGTGLGLAISRQIVRMHNGRVWAEPRDGGGSVFSIELPRNTTAPVLVGAAGDAT